MFRAISTLCVVAYAAAQSASRVEIVRPAQLSSVYEDGLVGHREALFGTPSYGEEIFARVYYATPSAQNEGCEPYASSDADAWQANGAFILLVDRGTCNFVKKVRNAEEAGAAAVIIADNQCLQNQYGYCDDLSIPSNGQSSTSPGTCSDGSTAHALDCSAGVEGGLPFLANDGSGDNIGIPSVIVSKQDSTNIKSALCNLSDKSKCGDNPTGDFSGNSVFMSISWDVPSDDDTVTWEMWTSSEDWYGAEFKSEFSRVAKDVDFEMSTHFTPHYLFADGHDWGCVGASNTNQCPDECTNNGLYCSEMPQGDSVAGLKGVDVVRENLRQLCVWQVVKDGHQRYRYWDYIVDFANNCFGEDEVETYEDLEVCSKQFMQENDLDVSKVMECVANSENDDGTNAILKNELAEAEQYLIFELPSIIINGVILRGSPTFGPVLTAICQAYKDGTEPEVCDAVLDPSGQRSGPKKLTVELDVCFTGDAGNHGRFDEIYVGELRSQLAFKAGHARESIEIVSKHLNPTSSEGAESCVGGRWSVKTYIHNLEEEEADDVTQELQYWSERNDIRFYTASSRSEGTTSVLVKVKVLKIDTESEESYAPASSTISKVGTSTSAGVIVMLVLLTLSMIGVVVVLAALWRRVGLQKSDLNIFSDMIAVPLRSGRQGGGQEMDSGSYQRPLGDGDYGRLDGDEEDDPSHALSQGSMVKVSIGDRDDDEVAL